MAAPIETLGDLRRSGAQSRPVKQEIRDNLVRKLQAGENAVPRHHRLRRDGRAAARQRHPVAPQLHPARPARAGQEPDPSRPDPICSTNGSPVVPGCEIHDDPLAPICAACRARVAREGDDMPIAWLPREARYVEKLATPDVTIADMVGDIDPIKAAAGGPEPLRRADDALRAAAAGEPRHLRDQRAAGSGGQDSGRPVQHPAGRRRPD